MKKIFTLVLCLSFLNGVYGQKAPFTLDDIYKVKGVGAPVLSPSGKYFAYTVTESTLNGGKSKTAVYLYDIEKKSSSKPEMDVKNSYNPFWGKSDNILYFTAVNEGKMQVFSYDFSSKTKRQLTKYFNEISNPILTSDERFLVFTSDVYPDCNGDQECNQKNIEAAEKGPVQAYMTDELLYRHWTEYSEGRVSHILVMDLSTSSIK
ncbi:MAG: hypothetical protein LWX56_08950, partial [Ignavibacteria bacterium]|nr:hypothetical protein [Ignavibacteria bacterium]